MKFISMLALLVFTGTGHAGPLDTWTWRNPTSIGISSVAFGQNQFVAVGAFGTILTSPDGITWTTRTSGGSGYLASVTYGNNRFVAVGDPGTILSSIDGRNWTTSNVAGSLSGVAYGNNQFVVVGDVILTSPDGNTWTTRISLTNSPLSAVTYGVGRFVAVGPSGTILSSEDGMTWTNRVPGTSYSMSGVAYGNGTFVAGGDDDENHTVLATSPDGINWNIQWSEIPSSPVNVAYCGNQFMVGLAGHIANAVTSPDGIAWTKNSLANVFNVTGFAYGNNAFVALVDPGGILSSPDGINWSDRTSKATGDLNGVAYGKNQFVAVGRQGPDPSDASIIVTSPDGGTWIDRSPEPGTAVYEYASCITYGNGKFVAVGTGSEILSSSDGITWSSSTPATDDDLSGVAYGNNQFVAVGSDNGTLGGAVLTSPDGVAWTRHTTGTNITLFAVAYGKDQFVAVGGVGIGYREVTLNSQGVVLTSPDGITWTSRPPGNTTTLEGVAYGNNLFVAVGLGGTVLSSSDGITWTNQGSGYDDFLGGVAYGNGQFVAVGGGYGPNDGIIVSSPDGVNWTIRQRGISLYAPYYGVTFGNNTFVVVGHNGAILQSAPLINLSLTRDANLGTLSLLLEGPTGLDYTIQSSTDLVSWQTVTNVIPAQSTTVILDALPATSERVFYRAYSQ
jgi:hypothetical protein